jgi:repressor LexA
LPARSRVPAEITRQILIESGHRCAVCGAGCPLERAHIIPWHKSKTHKAADLICLCANCHERADQEGWGEKTLREYKQRPWVGRQYEKVLDESEPRARIRIEIDLDPSQFSDLLQRLLQSGLAGFLEISPNTVRITSIERGSIRVTVELPAHSAWRFLSAYQRNDPELLKYLAPFILLDIRPAERQPVPGEVTGKRPIGGRERRVLDFIKQFVQHTGYPPTQKEIAAGAGILSASGVARILQKLEEWGYISRDREIARGIRLHEQPAPSSELIRLPLLGRIMAGEPIPVPGDFALMGGDTIALTRDILGDERGLYALQVQGDSMIDALVNDGDIVIVRYQHRVENGEMAVVWLKEREEVTLKRFYLDWEGRVRLQPANPTMKPIYVDNSQVEVQGKVVIVIRWP